MLVRGDHVVRRGAWSSLVRDDHAELTAQLIGDQRRVPADR